MLTNSALSADEPIAHLAYGRYRHQMLDLGVGLYELSPSRGRGLLRKVLRGEPVLRLHTKSVLFDDDAMFIGSLNFDPRSRDHNTELGLLIQSPGLVAETRDQVASIISRAAYRVWRTEDGSTLHWRRVSDIGREEPVAVPLVPWWRRLWLELLAHVIPEGLL